jgi:hypothetical protein
VLEVGQHPLAQFVGAACSVVTPQRRSTSLHAMPRSWQRRRSSGNTA